MMVAIGGHMEHRPQKGLEQESEVFRSIQQKIQNFGGHLEHRNTAIKSTAISTVANSVSQSLVTSTIGLLIAH